MKKHLLTLGLILSTAACQVTPVTVFAEETQTTESYTEAIVAETETEGLAESVDNAAESNMAQPTETENATGTNHDESSETTISDESITITEETETNTDYETEQRSGSWFSISLKDIIIQCITPIAVALIGYYIFKKNQR